MTKCHRAIWRTCWGLGALGLLLVIAPVALAGNFEVIVSKTVPVASVSKADLRAIFLGEKVKWDNSRYIKVVVPEDSELFKEFLQTVVGKTPMQFDKHWQNLVFTGKAAMPRSIADTAQLVDFVAGHPGTIGVVPAGKAGSSVKTISIK
ncbi:hypothetical protein GMLC_30820 [Geomonas limicola]|uniref:PBP domain-containing protein n=1 Tax=Geomonas limicola TaxID=2740186 RepID=A0A6V8ND87_9BACT|nr:hypothetical protein [Geomonas limicola]GFO69503.1 hypothetical protein GMLC_30820 [Geomonas limicola]